MADSPQRGSGIKPAHKIAAVVRAILVLEI